MASSRAGASVSAGPRGARCGDDPLRDSARPADGAVPLSHRQREAVYVLDGAATLRLDGEEHEIEAGDYVALPVGESGVFELFLSREAAESGLSKHRRDLLVFNYGPGFLSVALLL